MAALPDDDGLAPPLARAQPEWIADLLLLAKKDFGKLPSEQAEAFFEAGPGKSGRWPFCLPDAFGHDGYGAVGYSWVLAFERHGHEGQDPLV